MIYTRLNAAEAAAMINDQDTIGLSGFTPNGVPKTTFRELSKRAVAEHEAGRPFQVGILTGASTSQSIEGDMAAAHAIKLRAPFSTQHKTKGLEYKNVLVILKSNWTKYNFESLFYKTGKSVSIVERTKKLFYVCCTRAKENLVVYYPSAPNQVIEGAKKKFGERNIYKV